MKISMCRYSLDRTWKEERWSLNRPAGYASSLGIGYEGKEDESTDVPKSVEYMHKVVEELQA